MFTQTAISTVRRLITELAEQEVTPRIARAKARLREILRDTGLLEELGEEHVFPTVRAGVVVFVRKPEVSLKRARIPPRARRETTASS